MQVYLLCYIPKRYNGEIKADVLGVFSSAEKAFEARTAIITEIQNTHHYVRGALSVIEFGLDVFDTTYDKYEIILIQKERDLA